MSFKIGVISDCFRLSPREGIRKAKELGADGLQVYAVHGEICPESLDVAARRDLKRFCADLGLEIAALCGDLGGHGFQLAEENVAKVARSKRIVDLAVDLGTQVVTTHIGVVPEDVLCERYDTMRRACCELGRYASERGVTFAIETGPEPARRLREFLEAVDSPGIGVNMDPANLVMVVRDNPVEAVRTLGKYIVHTHAKDGRNLRPCDPERIYHAFAVGGVEGLNFGEYFEEVPLGSGDVHFDSYLAALGEVGFEGYLTIEREVGGDPARDIGMAIDFLREKIG